MNNMWKQLYKGENIYIPESELDDDTIKRFLVSMMLTNDWTEDFEPVHISVKCWKGSTIYTPHISDYLHVNKKLLKMSSHDDYKMEISVKGRKWLDKQKGEHDGTNK